MAQGPLQTVSANQDPTGKNTFNGKVQVDEVHPEDWKKTQPGDIVEFYGQEIGGLTQYPEPGMIITFTVVQERGDLRATNMQEYVKPGEEPPREESEPFPLEGSSTSSSSATSGNPPLETVTPSDTASTPEPTPEPAPAPTPTPTADTSTSTTSSGGEKKSGGCMGVIAFFVIATALSTGYWLL